MKKPQVAAIITESLLRERIKIAAMIRANADKSHQELSDMILSQDAPNIQFVRPETVAKNPDVLNRDYTHMAGLGLDPRNDEIIGIRKAGEVVMPKPGCVITEILPGGLRLDRLPTVDQTGKNVTIKTSAGALLADLKVTIQDQKESILWMELRAGLDTYDFARQGINIGDVVMPKASGGPGARGGLTAPVG